jgi:hypothetical protein
MLSSERTQNFHAESKFPILAQKFAKEEAYFGEAVMA